MSASRVSRLPFPVFLALRYLKPKRTAVSAITLISVIGVILGVMMLVVVIPVMTGFDMELRRKVIGFDAHLMVGNGAVLTDWQSVARTVKETKDVTDVAPFVMGPVIAQFNSYRTAPKIRGIDAEAESRITDLKKFIIAGELDLDGDNAVLGADLAEIMHAWVGDTIRVYSPGNLDSVLDELDKAEESGDKKTLQDLRELILPTELTVTGIFQSGRYQYDSEFLLVPLHIGQELYSLGPDVHGISVKTTDPYKVDEIKQAVNAKLKRPVQAVSWIDQNSQLFDAIRTERTVLFFLLFFIVLVAAFGIMSTLITVTVQKRREIGIMKALGASTAQVVWVFLGWGMIIGAFGTLLGMSIGMTVLRYRNEFSQWLANTLGVEIFPRQVYEFASIPAEIVPRDMAIICIASFVICSIAALLPSWSAARLDPVKALRYD